MKSSLIFFENEQVLVDFAKQGVVTCQANFNSSKCLADKFVGGDVLALISMSFVGERRQQAHKNALVLLKKRAFPKLSILP